MNTDDIVTYYDCSHSLQTLVTLDREQDEAFDVEVLVYRLDDVRTILFLKHS